MKYILVNYNYTPDWLKNEDYLIYDRSDSKDYLREFDQSRIVYTENVGNVDYDKLCYLVQNYDNLPDVFVWGKTNLFKYVTLEEFEKVKNNNTFTPLLTQNHRTYSDQCGKVCYYKDGIYYERNDSWYATNTKYFSDYSQFARQFCLDDPEYIPFAPGGNYILTKDTVYKYPKEFYKLIASYLPYTQLPSEAHMVERSYYSIWK